MSLFGYGARPQPSSEEKITAFEQEMKLTIDMQNRLSRLCSKKCIPNDYREGDLNKGESVCLDRCAAKFFDVHMKISEQMVQQQQQQMGGATGAGGLFGSS